MAREAHCPERRFQQKIKEQTYQQTHPEHGPTSKRDLPDDDRDHPPRFILNSKTAMGRQAIDTERISASSCRHAESQSRVNETFAT
jgi:hypothetical protein